MLGTISGLDRDKQIINREMANKILESKPLKTLGGKRDVVTGRKLAFWLGQRDDFFSKGVIRPNFNLDGNIPEETDRMNALILQILR